jgi:8-hydroxy-5-deazaflavin:NADPH oxidoreductase
VSSGLDVSRLRIGVLGGTGEQGRGLAVRLAAAGLSITLGSRDGDRAKKIAEELGHGVIGETNEACALTCDIVIVAVPWDGHEALLSQLQSSLRGKIVVDCVNPLAFDAQGAFGLRVAEGSAAEQAAALLPESRVVAAFHHLSAVVLNDAAVDSLDTDVLVLGEDRQACDLVQELASGLPGVRGIYAGRLRNAKEVEGLTASLIAVNRRYKVHAGLRVTDL